MKFNDYQYNKPDMQKFKTKFSQLNAKISEASSSSEQIDIIKQITLLRNDFETNLAIVEIRHSIDTKDEFYENENTYFDQIKPQYEELVDEFYLNIDKSKFRDALINEYGQHLFDIITMQRKAFDPVIMQDLQEENNLMSEYRKLRSSARINFNGTELNLEQIIPYYESEDRKIRKSAQQESMKFWIEHESEFDELFDKLVKVRHKMAIKLGYKNFTPLAYARLNRTDYGPKEVEVFRNQVLKELVPIASQLRERQQERLTLEHLYYYDEPISFKSGNAKPKGDSNWILKNGRKMYEELSEETAEFINFMLDNELMDLEAKEGKSGGGFCSYINNYKAPFIFSNFNGTSGDIDVLTHEAGHAFQGYTSRNYELVEYVWPTLDACEIHSMSMEFITWPWMKNFFKKDELKYKYNHLSEAILFIPYGVLVDEFQHGVYENPELSPSERKSLWRALEKKYLPHRKYHDNNFLERGGYWFRQGHIFSDPFYYIDYTLAEVCAFQFWEKFQSNRTKAWGDYLNLCTKGGSLSFLELVKIAKLNNPFEDGSIQKIIPSLESWLDSINDKEL